VTKTYNNSYWMSLTPDQELESAKAQFQSIVGRSKSSSLPADLSYAAFTISGRIMELEEQLGITHVDD